MGQAGEQLRPPWIRAIPPSDPDAPSFPPSTARGCAAHPLPLPPSSSIPPSARPRIATSFSCLLCCAEIGVARRRGVVTKHASS
eukprot:7593176-Alexandrium_andersonii.AAC.1